MNKSLPIEVEVHLPDSLIQEFVDVLLGLPKEVADSFRDRLFDLIRRSSIHHVRSEDCPAGFASRVVLDFPLGDFVELIAAARQAA